MQRRTISLLLCACVTAALLGADKANVVKWSEARSGETLTGLKASAGKQQGQTQTVDLTFDPADVTVRSSGDGQTVQIKGCAPRAAAKGADYPLPWKTFTVMLPKNAVVNGAAVTRSEYQELLGKFRPSRAAKVVVEGGPSAHSAATTEGASTKSAGAASKRVTTALPDVLPDVMIRYNSWATKDGQVAWVGVYPVRVDRRVDKMVLFNRLRIDIYYETE